ncbi:MAG: ribosome maturation factor RimM [Rickettsiales bacterium]|jgi:16S rRNA processing protein RimM|nr:ribosome maturation factor RimM [Rickettsiales bacterium]
MTANDKILVGRIAGARGIKGDVKIRTFTEDPASVCGYAPITDAGGRVFELAYRCPAGAPGTIVASIAGVSTRTEAERLKGVDLYAPRRAIAAGGGVLVSELVGLRVVDMDGGQIGTVEGMLNFGAGDIVEIRMPGRKKTALILFTGDGVRETDVKKGYMKIDTDYLLAD